jgi:hypothetical protein
MPRVPVDGRRQYPKLAVEIVNALNGREPTAGVQEQVGDRYILDRFPPASRASYGSGSTLPPLEPKAAAPKSAAQMLWPNWK